MEDFPGGEVVKNLPSNAGDTSSIPGWGTKIPKSVWCDQKKKKKIKVASLCLLGSWILHSKSELL